MHASTTACALQSGALLLLECAHERAAINIDLAKPLDWLHIPACSLLLQRLSEAAVHQTDLSCLVAEVVCCLLSLVNAVGQEQSNVA